MAWWAFWRRREPYRLQSGETYFYGDLRDDTDFYYSNSALRSVIDTIAGSLASVPLKFYNNNKAKVFNLSDVCVDDYSLVFRVTSELLQGRDVRVALTGAGRVVLAEPKQTYARVVTMSAVAWRGKIDALKSELLEARSASVYREQVWARAGRFGGWFERPVDAPRLDDTGRERLTKSLHAFQNNAPRAGETPVFEEGMKYHSETLSAKENEWKEAQELMLQHVANVYNLPISILTGGASERDRAYFYGDTMAGLARVIVSGFRELFHGYYVPRFNFDAKLSGSFLERAKILSTLAGRPVLDLDEARAIIDYAPYTGENMVTPLNVLTGGKTSPQDGGEILPIYEEVKQLTKEGNNNE